MGISGLLPFLEKASKKSHVSEYKGSTVAIDAYCWLHKGAFGCAEKLARGEDTDSYVTYCMKFVNMLHLHKITPIMVFDGQYLPAKKPTEEKRRKQRQAAKKKAAELLRLGLASEARKHVAQSVNVTHEMAAALIRECRRRAVDCVVAPYEADAQLAYLNRAGLADFVITEDSDLLLFGCSRIFVKMDAHGHGVMVEADMINACMKLRSDRFSFRKFRHMCILSGCDYLESLSGVGLHKALKFINATDAPDIYDALPKLPSYLNLTKAIVTEDYRNNFMLADATFQHQLVFDPRNRKLTHLNPVASDTKEEHLANIGEWQDDELAFQIALGNVDPMSYKKIDDWDPDKSILLNKSIWSKSCNNERKEFGTSSKTDGNVVKKRKPIATIERTDYEENVFDSNTKDILNMYQSAKAVRNREKENESVESESNDIYTVLHGNDSKPKKGLSAFNKTGLTIVDYKNGVYSRFFKPKEATKESEVDSLLSALDDVSKKRKSIDEGVDGSPENIEKRLRSDAESSYEIREDVVVIVTPPKEFGEGVSDQIKKNFEKQPLKRISSSKMSNSIIKKQTTMLSYFTKT